MAKIKVLRADGVQRVVNLDPDATRGATLGTDLFLPDGSVATPATLAAWINQVLSSTTVTSSGVRHHRQLQGLNVGDDHPQYVRKDTLTTLGDLYVRGASAPQRLPVGVEGDSLKVVGGVPTWAADLNVEGILPGAGIDVDDYDPEFPVVSLTAGALASLALADSAVQSVVAGANVTVDNTDPRNPVISATGGGGGYGGAQFLYELLDVDPGIVFAADGEVLTYDAYTGLWIAAPASGASYTGGAGIDITGTVISVDQAAAFNWTGAHTWTQFAVFEGALDSEFGYLGIRNSGANGATNLWFYNTDLAAGLKYWEIGTNTTSGGTGDGTSLNLNFYTDALAGKQAFRFIKNATALTQINLGNATDSPLLNLYADDIRGVLGTYEWLTADSDGSAGAVGTHFRLESDIYVESMIRVYDDGGYGGNLTFYYSRGTKASPSPVLNGDNLGGPFFGGRHDSSGWHFPAWIDYQVTGDATALGGIPGYLVFHLGTTTINAVDLMRLYSSGDIALRGPILLGAAEDVGTAGQVLTSQGPGADPIWTTVSGGGYGGAEYLYQLLDVDIVTVAPRLGDQLMFNGTDWITFSPRNVHYFFEDFTIRYNSTVGTAGWDAIASGTAASVTGYVADDVIGVIGLICGTSATGQAGVARSVDATNPQITGYKLNPGSGDAVFRARVRVAGALPSAAQTTIIRVGLMDEINGAPDDGVYLGIDTNIYSSPDWFGSARDGTYNGVAPTTIVTAVLNQYYLLEFRYTASTNTVEFFVDGVSVGSTSSNIPTNALTLAANVQKLAGTTSITLDIDYFEFIQFINRG